MNKSLDKYEKSDVILTDYYYREVLKKDYNNQNYNRTRATIQYLFDSGFNDEEIIKELRLHSSDAIRGEDLKTVYKDSLIKKGAFYLHRELRIEAPAPVLTKDGRFIEYPYFIEIKPRYTKEDVLNYFISKLSPLNQKAIDINGTYVYIKYLMDRYKNIDYVEPLDVILCLIDTYLEEYGTCTRLIDVTTDPFDTILELVKSMQELQAMDKRKIIWRTIL